MHPCIVEKQKTFFFSINISRIYFLFAFDENAYMYICEQEEEIIIGKKTAFYYWTFSLPVSNILFLNVHTHTHARIYRELHCLKIDCKARPFSLFFFYFSHWYRWRENMLQISSNFDCIIDQIPIDKRAWALL